MFLYDFKCDSCGKVQEHLAKIDEKIKDCDCGGLMARKITAKYFINGCMDFVTDSITGDPVRITSHKQMNELCKKHDVMPKIGKGWY